MKDDEKFSEENPGTIMLGNALEIALPVLIAGYFIFCVFVEFK